MQNGFKSAFLVLLSLPPQRLHYNFVAFDTDKTTLFVCGMESHCIFFPPLTSPDYDHLHLKLISLKEHGQCLLSRILGGSKNFRPEEIWTPPCLIFTIMRLCAHMHSQSKHLFVKSTKETVWVFLHYMKQSACLREISFTCFKTCNAVTSVIRFCGKVFIFSVPSAVHLSVRKLLFRYRISAKATGRIFSKLVCSPRRLDVSARKWFWSVDKCSRRQPSLIFSFIACPPKPLEDFCLNLAYEFLSMSRCVRPKRILVCQKQI